MPNNFNIFTAAFYNDIQRIDEILAADPAQINVRCTIELPAIVCKAVGWSLLVGKKAGSIFLGLAALVPLGAAGTATVAAAEVGVGASVAASGTLLATAKAAWEWGDATCRVITEDREGWTALHFAAYSGSLETTLHLIEKGADVNLKDNLNRTYLDLAPTEAFKSACRSAVTRRNDAQSAQNNARELGQLLGQNRGREAELRDQVRVAGNGQQQLQNQLDQMLVEHQGVQARVNAVNQELAQFRPVGQNDRGTFFFRPFQAAPANQEQGAAPQPNP